MENLITRVLLWLESLNLIDRMMAVTAIMLGAAFVGAFVAFALIGFLCMM